MLLSGAVCGLAGFLIVAGLDHTITTTLAGGRGFLGVMVAWLAHFNPISMVLSSLLLVFMEKGAGEISTAYGLNQSFGDILTGIILFFVIGSEFFINYKIHFRGKAKESTGTRYASSGTAPAAVRETAADEAVTEAEQVIEEAKEAISDIETEEIETEKTISETIEEIKEDMNAIVNTEDEGKEEEDA